MKGILRESFPPPSEIVNGSPALVLSLVLRFTCFNIHEGEKHKQPVERDVVQMFILKLRQMEDRFHLLII